MALFSKTGFVVTDLTEIVPYTKSRGYIETVQIVDVETELKDDYYSISPEGTLLLPYHSNLSNSTFVLKCYLNNGNIDTITIIYENVALAQPYLTINNFFQLITNKYPSNLYYFNQDDKDHNYSNLVLAKSTLFKEWQNLVPLLSNYFFYNNTSLAYSYRYPFEIIEDRQFLYPIVAQNGGADKFSSAARVCSLLFHKLQKPVVSFNLSYIVEDYYSKSDGFYEVFDGNYPYYQFGIESNSTDINIINNPASGFVVGKVPLLTNRYSTVLGVQSFSPPIVKSDTGRWFFPRSYIESLSGYPSDLPKTKKISIDLSQVYSGVRPLFHTTHIFIFDNEIELSFSGKLDIAKRIFKTWLCGREVIVRFQTDWGFPLPKNPRVNASRDDITAKSVSYMALSLDKDNKITPYSKWEI